MPVKIKKQADLEEMAEIVLPNTCVMPTARTTQLMVDERAVINGSTLMMEITLKAACTIENKQST